VLPPDAPPPLVPWEPDRLPESVAALPAVDTVPLLRDVDGVLYAVLAAVTMHRDALEPVIERVAVALLPDGVALHGEGGPGRSSAVDRDRLARKWAHTLPDQRDASVLFMQVLDTIVDGYDVALAALRERVERVEERLLGDTLSPAAALEELLRLNRRVSDVRGVALPLRNAVREELHLREPLEQGLVSRAALRWLETLEEDLLHDVPAALEVAEDRISSALAQVQGARGEETNRVVLLLTLLATAFFPSTLVAGLYGMNVPLPAQDEDAVFWAVVAASVALLVLVTVAALALGLDGTLGRAATDSRRARARRRAD
jgi:hypothetical protein